MNDLGNRLRFLRKERGLTQSEVGLSVGLAATDWSAWERGTCAPGIANLRRITRSLKLTNGQLGWLVYGDE